MTRGCGGNFSQRTTAFERTAALEWRSPRREFLLDPEAASGAGCVGWHLPAAGVYLGLAACPGCPGRLSGFVLSLGVSPNDQVMPPLPCAVRLSILDQRFKRVFHVKPLPSVGAERFRFRTSYTRLWRSLGETPGIRAACPMDGGRSLVSFSLAS